ncbi:hypothetical protein [Mesomycoplasma ovipneumoniae]|uniref:hypothetical protein n=1 Tax=Mesomycoplasma ovipneumoniae TaxID=29562 RepID=UPI0028AF7E4B|nr:hypothetical protein [Mesomycoplasma ovipneumoniae]WNM15427.1 hypothetical protein RNM01_02230 [Mesomycoplasma ovipneumoniae]
MILILLLLIFSNILFWKIWKDNLSQIKTWTFIWQAIVTFSNFDLLSSQFDGQNSLFSEYKYAKIR